jgi:S-adenosylmethionine synthetase
MQAKTPRGDIVKPMIGLLQEPLVEDLDAEIVERKGLGHPDSLCDALAEAMSLSFSRHCRDHFGLILHHNVDKVLLVGGEARPVFGGGEVTKPMRIFISGRGSSIFGDTRVPIEDLAIESSRAWLRGHMHALDPERDVEFRILVRSGSQDLVELFQRQKESGVWLANDTSLGVGFAPFSPLERVVYTVERHLNAPEMRRTYPAIGEDIKVMGVRRGRHIQLTLACAMIGRHLESLTAYADSKRMVAEAARIVAAEEGADDIEVSVNSADDLARGSVYLTVTGTSAEAGDDGEAGRGNRVNGVITPYRPMTMESVAGKNPVSHVGKLYNLAAGLIVERIVSEVPTVRAAQAALVSRIGQPVTEPQLVDLKVALRSGAGLAEIRSRVEEIAEGEVAAIPGLVEELLSGRLAPNRWPLRVNGEAAGR